MNLTPIYDPPEQPKPHPICLLMPSADEDELQSLTDDIRAHGLLDPIVLFERRILDGRNRAAACESAGREPRYVEFEGTREEALMFVVSHNLKRRHLNKQAIADTLVEAEDFNLHYELGEPAARSDIKMSAQKPKTASSRELAKAAGGAVSREMINATRKVKEKAEPELREAVKKGANWRSRCCQGGRSAARSAKGHCRIAKTKKSRERGHRGGEERGCALCQR